MSSKKDLLRDKMKELSKPVAIKPMSLDDLPARDTANAVATTNNTQNAVVEEKQAEKTYNYDEFTLPNPNPTTDLKGKRYQEGEPLHTVRYSFQITEELKENLKYYKQYVENKGGTFNESVFLREALAKALKKEPRG